MLSFLGLCDTCGVLSPLLLFRLAFIAGKSLSPCCSCLWSTHTMSAVSGSWGTRSLQEGLIVMPADTSFMS